MQVKIGTRFMRNEHLWEVKKVFADEVLASKVNPNSGKTGRGRPTVFKRSSVELEAEAYQKTAVTVSDTNLDNGELSIPEAVVITEVNAETELN